jgi:hypothetical protein
MINLQTTVDEAARTFVETVTAALREALYTALGGTQAGLTLTETSKPIHTNGTNGTNGHAHANGFPAHAEEVAIAPARRRTRSARKASTAAKAKSERMPRRTTAQIAEGLSKVLSALKGASEGLRAEHLREKVGCDARELPRLLKEGIKTKQIRAEGKKRATVYSLRA